MSLDSREYSREVFSTLDFASDLGGLFGAIAPFFVSVLTIVNFYSSYQFLMDDLYVTKAKGFGWFQKKLEKNHVQWRPFHSLYLTIVTLILPSCCKCCISRDRRTSLRIKGLNKVLYESSIANIIRQLRVLNALAKTGKTEK